MRGAEEMQMTITVGQAVAVQSSYNYDAFNFDYVVAKVTPKG